MSSIGKALREARLAADIKQTDLAAAIGVSAAFLNRVERGAARTLSRERLARLPDEIRPAVVDAMIQDLERQALAVEAAADGGAEMSPLPMSDQPRKADNLKISVPLTARELCFLLELLGPERDVAAKTRKLYRSLKRARATLRGDQKP